MRIPADVAVRLMVDAAAFTVAYPLVQTITGTGFTFTSPCINRRAVTGNGKVSEIDQAIVNGFAQKNRLENIKKPPCRSEILRWFCFEPGQQVV